jgi:hypothetical protein
MILAALGLLFTAIGFIGFFVHADRSDGYKPTCDGKPLDRGDRCWIMKGDGSGGVKSYDDMVRDHYDSADSSHDVMTTIFYIALPLTLAAFAGGVAVERRYRRWRFPDAAVAELAAARGWTVVRPGEVRAVAERGPLLGRLIGEFQGWRVQADCHEARTLFLVLVDVPGLKDTIFTFDEDYGGARSVGDPRLGDTSWIEPPLRDAATRAHIPEYHVTDAYITCSIPYRVTVPDVDAAFTALVLFADGLAGHLAGRPGSGPQAPVAG